MARAEGTDVYGLAHFEFGPGVHGGHHFLLGDVAPADERTALALYIDAVEPAQAGVWFGGEDDAELAHARYQPAHGASGLWQ